LGTRRRVLHTPAEPAIPHWSYATWWSLPIPEEAKENGIGGTVVVEVLIDKQGVPQAIHAVRGNPILATTAFKALQQWRWKPYRLNRVPVAVEMTIAMNFEP
jgi:TonB family protein